ncbi:aldo/keto reductase [Actinoalloteichus fjordicus]|uniref:Oxidoreductase, aryl-alcohol dehydrogenase like protein n=1 Tax=Actinoalloteichus fjordicus TaxID=1612552 RepID=A0AAC9LE53_9PSEU|nr:aldo/keto reductase [Actinoalloteichus fjordicus]APU15204.1 putative oxidoreductase, aryl-alcohol dehydrogenase like protein [Actinoalloteichus fjordicus]
MTSGPTSVPPRVRPPLSAVSGPAALGTFEFGTAALPPHRAQELLDAYYRSGGRLIDTAPTYGPGDGAFHAEPLIATWLHATGAPDVHVITKAGLHPSHPDSGDLRPETILRHARHSADRLGIPFTLVLHRDAPTIGVDEIADAVDRVVREGLADRVGASNWTTDRLENWIVHARQAGLAVPEVTAPLWSLAPRAQPPPEPWLVEADPVHLALAVRNRMTITPFRTLAAGFLTTRHTGRHSAHHAITYDTPTGRARRARLQRAALALRMTPHGLALAYLRALGSTVVPVIGPRTLVQLRECMAGAAASDRVTPDLAAYLEARS